MSDVHHEKLRGVREQNEEPCGYKAKLTIEPRPSVTPANRHHPQIQVFWDVTVSG